MQQFQVVERKWHLSPVELIHHKSVELIHIERKKSVLEKLTHLASHRCTTFCNMLRLSRIFSFTIVFVLWLMTFNVGCYAGVSLADFKSESAILVIDLGSDTIKAALHRPSHRPQFQVCY
jgi:hypothetical protein